MSRFWLWARGLLSRWQAAKPDAGFFQDTGAAVKTPGKVYGRFLRYPLFSYGITQAAGSKVGG
jgi:hypothetical protein